MTNRNVYISFIMLSSVFLCVGVLHGSSRNIHQWFDDTFDALGKRFDKAFYHDSAGIFTDEHEVRPQITVTSKDDHMVITLDLKVVPIGKKDCVIEATGDLLTLNIETNDLNAHFSIKNYQEGALMSFDLEQKNEKDKKASKQSFSAIKTVQKTFNFEKTDASFKDGMLRLMIPYKVEQKKVKIALK